MKLLILILNKVEKLEEILEGYIEVGVTGATVVESVGMGHILCDEIPIFAGLRFMFAGSKPQNKIVLSAVREEKAEPAIRMVKKILGDMNNPGTGIIFTLPIENVEGLKPEL